MATFTEQHPVPVAAITEYFGTGRNVDELGGDDHSVRVRRAGPDSR